MNNINEFKSNNFKNLNKSETPNGSIWINRHWKFYNIIWQATISGLLKINDTVSVCGSNQQRRNKKLRQTYSIPISLLLWSQHNLLQVHKGNSQRCGPYLKLRMLIVTLAFFDVRWPKLETYAYMLYLQLFHGHQPVLSRPLIWAAPNEFQPQLLHRLLMPHEDARISSKCNLVTSGHIQQQSLFPEQSLVWLNSTVPFSAVKNPW